MRGIIVCSHRPRTKIIVLCNFMHEPSPGCTNQLSSLLLIRQARGGHASCRRGLNTTTYPNFAPRSSASASNTSFSCAVICLLSPTPPFEPIVCWAFFRPTNTTSSSLESNSELLSLSTATYPSLPPRALPLISPDLSCATNFLTLSSNSTSNPFIPLARFNLARTSLLALPSVFLAFSFSASRALARIAYFYYKWTS